MGFYGKVINYLSKAFNKIKINNEVIQATGYDDELEIHADKWIDLKLNADNNSINIMHGNAKTPIDKQPCSISIEQIETNTEDGIKIEGDITDGKGIIFSLPTFDERGHQSGSQIYHLKLLTDKLKQDILGEGNVAEAFDTLQEIAAWIQQEGVDATDLTTEIAKLQKQLQNYATTEFVSQRIEEIVSYTESLIDKLNVAPSGIPNRYISDISQISGKIEPVYVDLPFDYPKAINLEYNEEKGDLSFPTYFKVFANGEAPAFIYVYDGGEI